ncbi:ferredoxin-thioredoxin reductase catalytic domain-containing protein [Methanosalsum natronophilum]|uniref:ferredoxin:thioredoxin reductase n=1 Tax=Methanosalsum natronophilum TaxID=768733 RepID=A0A3R7XHN6_9EURY|nr:ferredoxin-thioredoxin reductase catalytic domain-containing protein [Methanosalsum natronophilum]MCS3924617.1 ferredoxin-thioredoxin reductase catalytic subunit [Methanosalsum natronophilum]RQD84642.1 MAG: ferredoxin:thioredoxin reductase [Methanosalsum natronophilum]
MVEETKKKIRNWTQRYADRKGYDLNPDNEMLDMVIEGLANNVDKYGRRYCPCRIITGNEQEDRKIICPCIYHEEEVETQGSCHCSLFFEST